MKAYINWSGGKDAALALHYAQRNKDIQVAALFTSVNVAHNRISMHGVRRALLEQQAHSIGLPLYTAELPEEPGMSDYERIMKKEVTKLKDRGFEAAVFGDIFLEDLRQYRENGLAQLDVACLFPLWKKNGRMLLSEFLDLGFKAIIVCVNNAALSADFCGRIINSGFIDDLPAGVDPCGENGEYHSFVFDGPNFRHPVPFTTGARVYREYAAPNDSNDQCFSASPRRKAGFYFQDLMPL